MKSDTIKSAGAVIIAGIIVIGGMAGILILTWAGKISGDAALGTITALMGGAAAWIFGRDATTGGQRAAERAVTLGANAAAGTIPPPPPGS